MAFSCDLFHKNQQFGGSPFQEKATKNWSAKNNYIHLGNGSYTRWWFHFFSSVIPIWGNDPNCMAGNL